MSELAFVSDEAIDQALEKYNATLLFVDMKELKAFTYFESDKYYIVINSNLKENVFLNWIIAHEIEHIKNNAFYSRNASQFEIIQKEIIVNDDLILSSGLYDIILDEVENSALDPIVQKELTCERLTVPGELYDYVLTYIQRRRIILYDKIITGLFGKKLER